MLDQLPNQHLQLWAHPAPDDEEACAKIVAAHLRLVPCESEPRQVLGSRNPPKAANSGGCAENERGR